MNNHQQNRTLLYIAIALLAMIAGGTATLAGIGVIVFSRQERASSEARQEALEQMRRNHWNADVLSTIADMEDKGEPLDKIEAYQKHHYDNPPRDYVMPSRR